MNPTSHLQMPVTTLPLLFMKHSPCPAQIFPRNIGHVTWHVAPTYGSLQSQRVLSGRDSLSLTQVPRFFPPHARSLCGSIGQRHLQAFPMCVFLQLQVALFFCTLNSQSPFPAHGCPYFTMPGQAIVHALPPYPFLHRHFASCVLSSTEQKPCPLHTAPRSFLGHALVQSLPRQPYRQEHIAFSSFRRQVPWPPQIVPSLSLGHS